jgi:hypothetical protein
MKGQLWSQHALAKELGHNERTIARMLDSVPADGKITGGHRGWYLTTALAALSEYSASSSQLRPTVAAKNDWRSDPCNHPPPPYLAAAADKALAMLDRVFDATTVEERRAAYDPKALDEWDAAFEREYEELGPDFERLFRPAQSSGRDYYRALVAKMLGCAHE